MPKRLGWVHVHKKARVHFRFACDVVVDGDVIRPTGTIKHSVLCMEVWKGRKRKNGTYQRVTWKLVGMRIDCSGYPLATGCYGECSPGSLTISDFKPEVKL